MFRKILNGWVGVALILLSTTATAQQTENQPNQQDGVAKKKDTGVFFVSTQSKSKIVGQLDMDESLTIATEFGELQIPWEQIGALMFEKQANTAQDEKSADGASDSTSTHYAIVALKDGDRISGHCTLSTITVNTDWGVAKINCKDIIAVKSDSNIRFSKLTTPLGTSWQVSSSPNRNSNSFGQPQFTNSTYPAQPSFSPGNNSNRPSLNGFRANNPNSFNTQPRSEPNNSRNPR